MDRIDLEPGEKAFLNTIMRMEAELLRSTDADITRISNIYMNLAISLMVQHLSNDEIGEILSNIHLYLDQIRTGHRTS